MHKKWLLYIGIALLLFGLIIRIIYPNSILYIPLIIIGLGFKIAYLTNKTLSHKYKPGYEILILAVGLCIFFAGIYLKNQNLGFNHWYLMGPGLFMKICFIVIFMRKMRK